MRIGHASISENGNNGRDGRAKAGDQTGKEVCIRTFYKKPWVYLLRCKDSNKAEIMAQACEWLCNSNLIGYDQSQRNTLHNEMVKLNYDYKKLKTPCECDCSSFQTVLAEISGIFPKYSGNNAPVTANMVGLFQQTGYFDVLTDGINDEKNLRRGDILVGAPNTHTVMVLDNGSNQPVNKPVANTVAKPTTPTQTGYKVGQTYTTTANLFVRCEPKGEKKLYSELSANAKKNAYNDGHGFGILKKGTRVTCKAAKVISNQTWLQIPSGWICAIDNGKVYIN